MRHLNNHLVLVPCAAAKLDVPAAARDLYASANFQHMLRAALTEAADTTAVLGVPARVMILSAEHGLLELDTVVAPYDTKMGDAGCVTPAVLRDQLAATGATTVEAMLPAAYYDALAAAVADNNDDDTAPWIELLNVYEAAPGIGYQRGVASSLVRTAGTLSADAA